MTVITHPEVAQSLANAHGFRLQDLAQNRAGRLTPRQQALLLLNHLAFAGLTLAAPLILFGLFRRLNRTPGTGTESILIFITLVLPLVALGLIVLWNTRGLVREVLGGRVANTAARVRPQALTRVIRGRSDTTYVYQVEALTFPVSPAAFEALSPNLVYRVYYLPRSGKLVSLEPIG